MNPLERALEIHTVLASVYDSTASLLVYGSPFELLVSVVLSAQTTDAQVNRVTPELFRRYPDPATLAQAPIDDLEAIIRPIGFYRVKARMIRDASAVLEERFGGTVPARMADLIAIPGVGRKSANVILGHAFGEPAVIVDTHFKRVSKRVGITESDNPDTIEQEIRSFLPPEIMTDFSMEVNLHGRYVCRARTPECFRCPILDLCGYPEKNLTTK